MTRILSLLFLGLSSLAWSGVIPRSTSPHVEILEGKLQGGYILTSSDKTEEIHAQIREQLKFTVGTLNAFRGGAAIDYSLKVTPTSVTPKGKLFEVEYDASLLFAWNYQYQIPSSWNFVLPERADKVGLKNFYDAHGKQCGGDNHGWGQFFYYYRPNTCYLTKGSFSAAHAVSAKFTLAKSPLSTQGKSPDYARMWEDGTLKTIALFGNQDSRDANQYFQFLRKWFGNPSSDEWTQHGDHTLRKLVFQSSRGPIEVNIFNLLKGNMGSASQTLIDQYNTLSTQADYVAYNGHSGLGSNIRAVLKLGAFQPKQHTLFYLNGCDSFSYVNHHQEELHLALNPDEPANRYVEFVVTAVPSLFNQMAYGTARILWGLAHSSETYGEILKDIGNGVPIVLGEEDN